MLHDWHPMRCAQSASLVLTTTPPEELAAGLTALLSPLRLIGVPAKEIGASIRAQSSCPGRGQGRGQGYSRAAAPGSWRNGRRA